MKARFADGDRLTIHTESLKNGHVEKLKERFSPDFIDVHEERLEFCDPVIMTGEAYLAEAELVLHLNLATKATIPCSICNEPVKVQIDLQDVYISEPLDQIKTGVFSLADPLREAILIETPAFAECNQGSCPKRKELEKYFKKPLSSEAKDPDGYRPFENFKLD